MKMRKTVFLGILAMALTMAFTACPGPNDTGLPTTGTVVGAVTFAGNASGSVTLELKTASGGQAYMYRVVTPDSTEVRFTEVTPGTFFLYAYVRGVREQLRYNVPVTAGGVYTLSGGITITTCGCGLGAGDGCTGQCTDTVCGCGLGSGDGCDCDYGTDTVCGCGLGTGDGCDCAQTVATGIILSHTGTIYIPFNEYRIIYATMVPSTAAFQWVEWTVDSDLVTITRIPRPRAGIFTGPETAILINTNEVGTATITATAMGSGPVELSVTLTVIVERCHNCCVDCDCVEMGICSSGCSCYTTIGNFVRVRGGSFRMGYCPSGEGLWCGSPIRTVTVSGFYMGVFPVTQGEWYDVMGTNPSGFYGGHWAIVAAGANWRNLPVEQVSWFDAVAFANALSVRAGLEPAYTINGTTVTWNRYANGYRLPTEAEWEFAARGGIVCQEGFVFSGSNTANDVAWTSANSGNRTHEVGQLMPNALGLYDMSGNVWEWVWDWFGVYPGVDENDPTGPAAGGYRVIRGGSWDYTPDNVRSAHRHAASPGHRGTSLGFRVVRL